MRRRFGTWARPSAGLLTLTLALAVTAPAAAAEATAPAAQPLAASAKATVAALPLPAGAQAQATAGGADHVHAGSKSFFEDQRGEARARPDGRGDRLHGLFAFSDQRPREVPVPR